MDHFNYKNNVLYAENVNILDINIPTPFYCYSSATLKRHFNVFKESFRAIDPIICFAVKANSNIAVLKTLAKEGAGADCVSIGEVIRALKAGIDSKKIILSGVGKTKKEMEFAIQNNILQFNIESVEELYALNDVAELLGKKPSIAFRVNPDIDAGTHDKISTGRKEDKFGIAFEKITQLYDIAAKLSNVEVEGVATHIGSQLTSLEPFKLAFNKVANLVRDLKAKGHKIKRLDLGGGLGIPYSIENPPSPSDYAKEVIEIVKDLDCKIIFEPGRLIAGNAGILVTSVINTKKTDVKDFLIIDAAMNDLMRPALYDSFHEVVPVKYKDPEIEYDIVGPICETTDVLAKNRKLPVLKNDDMIAFRSAGAYGFVMANSYNTRPIIAEILVDDDKYAVIREHQTIEELISKDLVPSWLK